MKELTHISLFAGIAGIDLAAEWAGFRTILFVEIDPFCQKVLNKHWPDVPIIGDIRDATKEKVMDIAFGSGYFHRQAPEQSAKEGKQTFGESESGSEYGVSCGRSSIKPITLITGGFPCQPVSQAGKRRGEADDRWLWPEMLRVISEVRPTWVVAENVTGLLTMGFYDCLSNLESEGYETISFVIPACSVNAPHRRDRIFIVGYTEHAGWDGSKVTGRFREGRNLGNGEEGQVATGQLTRPDSSSGRAEDVANTQGSRIGQEFSQVTGKLLREDRTPQELKGSSGDDSHAQGKGLEGADSERATQPWRCLAEYIGGDWWTVEPDVGRVAYGIPSRVDRLKALGNAVVPQQIYPILKAIADIELGDTTK